LSRHTVRFSLNGHAQELEVAAERRLIDVLREDCALTGTKEGCSVGVCGACSVLVDGEVMSACLLPAPYIDGASVITIEGLAREGTLSRLQESFITEGGFQCGICTPGQIITATALLAAHPRPSDTQIGEWMMGNLCRCTGYHGIARAIKKAAKVPGVEGAEPLG
jgi:carbon-monoxide dehydrogenase small subunit